MVYLVDKILLKSTSTTLYVSGLFKSVSYSIAKPVWPRSPLWRRCHHPHHATARPRFAKNQAAQGHCGGHRWHSPWCVVLHFTSSYHLILAPQGPTAFGRIPGFTEHIFPDDSRPFLSLVANIGLCLFLFIVGLEIDSAVIKRNARLSVTVATAGMVLPFGMFCIPCLW